MIDINKCKDMAKSLADQSKEKLGEQKFQEFTNAFNRIVNEYYNKYMVFSYAVNLQKLKSFNEWLPSIKEDQSLLTPIIVDKMVNEEDLYSLSLYQNLYFNTNCIPDISGFKEEHMANGGGENALALITRCYWIEQTLAETIAE